MSPAPSVVSSQSVVVPVAVSSLNVALSVCEVVSFTDALIRKLSSANAVPLTGTSIDTFGGVLSIVTVTFSDMFVFGVVAESVALTLKL